MSNDVPEDFMTPDSLKRALKTFRKRLRLTRLDAESKLGGGALSGGKHSALWPFVRQTVILKRCGKSS